MTSELLLFTLGVLVAVPFVVYLSVKLGTYAFFRGRELFEQTRERRQEAKHGDETTT